MISNEPEKSNVIDFLDSIAAGLKNFRGDGQKGLVLFDGRDHGNYGDNGAARTNAMLRKHDPTGLAEALLLNEKIEATITHSKVKLSRVLREDGCIKKLQHILSLKSQLLSRFAEPMEALTSYLDSCLKAISCEFRSPSSREIALCLRDAIYCMNQGFTLRWLACDGNTMPAHLPLCSAIGHFPNIPTFTDLLRTELPFGAHLARIGESTTVIGLKHPGKIAFLSSLSIDIHTGYMKEQAVEQSNIADQLDIDHATARYPKWVEAQYTGEGYRSNKPQVITAGRDSHFLDHISKLPIDRLIWLAMTVEMAAQKMAATDPSSVSLAESVARALPWGGASVDAGADSESRIKENLPMVITPNWTAEEITIESMFDSLGFSEWERTFLFPAFDGLAAADFLPEEPLQRIHLDTRRRIESPAESKWNYSERLEILENSVAITSVSQNWVGSQVEVNNFRKTIFGKNLVHYLIAWGNRRFRLECKEIGPWFEKRLKKNIEAALKHPCVVLKDKDSGFRRGILLYSQKAGKVNFNPMCYFNPKVEMVKLAHIFPQSSSDLVDVLGLKSEKYLPEFLQGWKRDFGSWTTTQDHTNAPFGTTDQWCLSVKIYRDLGRDSGLEAVVCVGSGRI